MHYIRLPSIFFSLRLSAWLPWREKCILIQTAGTDSWDPFFLSIFILSSPACICSDHEVSISHQFIQWNDSSSPSGPASSVSLQRRVSGTDWVCLSWLSCWCCSLLSAVSIRGQICFLLFCFVFLFKGQHNAAEWSVLNLQDIFYKFWLRSELLRSKSFSLHPRSFISVHGNAARVPSRPNLSLGYLLCNPTLALLAQNLWTGRTEGLLAGSEMRLWNFVLVIG